MKTIRKTTWNTYAVKGHAFDITGDRASAGGVHLHQVRQTRGGWQKRIVQSNGGRSSAGEIHPISDADGEAFFALAGGARGL